MTPFSETERNQIIEKYFSRAAKWPVVYLANHSLGRPLDQTADSVNSFVELWHDKMDDAWTDWLEAITEFQTLVSSLLGTPRPDCIVPKTSAGQGLRAVLNAFPTDQKVKVVTTSLEFDSIDFILKVYEQKGKIDITSVKPDETKEIPLFNLETFLDAITQNTDLVVLSHVNFNTGQIMPGIDKIVEKAHSCGALVLLDLYHSFGVLPLDQIPAVAQADFCISGSYKYAHGGPGACWLSVNPKIVDEKVFQTLDTGWFAKHALFGYDRTQETKRADDGRAWWESTPAVLPVYQALPGLRFLREVGVDRLRATSLVQQQSLRNTFQAHEIPIFTPDDPAGFGAFSVLPVQNHETATAITKMLKSKGVKVDSRANLVRFCPDLINIDDEFQTTALELQKILKETS